MNNQDYANLKAIAGKLAAVAVMDADPDNWTGSGIRPGDLTEDERGNAYWCRKLAGQTLTVLTKVMSVCGIIERNTREGEPPDEAAIAVERETNAELAIARREATKMLKLVRRNGRAA